MKALVSAVSLVSMLGGLPALAAENSFERTLKLPATGAISLHVVTGSGYIHLSQGMDDQIRIVGHVRSTVLGEGDDAIAKILKEPPIDASSGEIRVGSSLHNVRNIVVDFEIQAPVRISVDAFSASGNVDDDGVGLKVRLKTGSGDIHANALKGDAVVGTGSGNIFAEEAGTGDVRASAGSGNIELRGLSGTVRAQTGSGDIVLMGKPLDGWHAITGTGNVDVWPDQRSFSILASTGSGGIRVDSANLHVSQADEHGMTANVGRGGSTIQIETGTGDIRVH